MKNEEQFLCKQEYSFLIHSVTSLTSLCTLNDNKFDYKTESLILNIHCIREQRLCLYIFLMFIPCIFVLCL
jgi:hypothetical protein